MMVKSLCFVDSFFKLFWLFAFLMASKITIVIVILLGTVLSVAALLIAGLISSELVAWLVLIVLIVGMALIGFGNKESAE